MSLPVVTAENYYSPEMNMAYMGSTQFKAFEKCEAAGSAGERDAEIRRISERIIWKVGNDQRA